MMLIIATVIISAWFLWGIIKLSFTVAWGITKAIAWILSILALPLLLIIALTAGGFILLLPVVLLAAAFAVLKSC